MISSVTTRTYEPPAPLINKPFAIKGEDPFLRLYQFQVYRFLQDYTLETYALKK